MCVHASAVGRLVGREEVGTAADEEEAGEEEAVYYAVACHFGRCVFVCVCVCVCVCVIMYVRACWMKILLQMMWADCVCVGVAVAVDTTRRPGIVNPAAGGGLSMCGEEEVMVCVVCVYV